MGIFSYRFRKREKSFFSANKIVLPYNLKCAFLVSDVLKACDEYQLQMLADCIVLISGISFSNILYKCWLCRSDTENERNNLGSAWISVWPLNTPVKTIQTSRRRFFSRRNSRCGRYNTSVYKIRM